MVYLRTLSESANVSKSNTLADWLIHLFLQILLYHSEHILKYDFLPVQSGGVSGLALCTAQDKVTTLPIWGMLSRYTLDAASLPRLASERWYQIRLQSGGKQSHANQQIW